MGDQHQVPPKWWGTPPRGKYAALKTRVAQHHKDTRVLESNPVVTRGESFFEKVEKPPIPRKGFQKTLNNKVSSNEWFP